MSLGSQLKAVGAGATIGLVMAALLGLLMHLIGPVWYATVLVAAGPILYGIGCYLERKSKRTAQAGKEAS